MTLREKIQSDLLESMKAKDEARMTALRMLKAAIMKFEVAGEKKKEASDDEVLQLIGKEVKQRKESIDAFRKGNREDLAVKEEAEMKALANYLPEQLSEEGVKKVVQEVIAATGAKGKGDFGKVMGATMARVKGRADGALVGKLVGQLLG